MNQLYFMRITRDSLHWEICGRVVSDIQTRAEGQMLYVRYNTDTDIVKYLWYEWMRTLLSRIRQLKSLLCPRTTLF